MPSGAVTVAVTVQLPLAGIPPPERLTAPDPAVAVATPPHVLVKPLGVLTTVPAGRVSVNATPASAAEPLGFAMKRVRVVAPPGRILTGTNDFVIKGGAITITAAVEVLPVPFPPLVEVT